MLLRRALCLPSNHENYLPPAQPYLFQRPLRLQHGLLSLEHTAYVEESALMDQLLIELHLFKSYKLIGDIGVGFFL